MCIRDSSYAYEGLWIEIFDSDTVFKPYRIIGLVIIALFALKQAGMGKTRPLRFDRYDGVFVAIIVGGFMLALFWYLIAGTGDLSAAVNDTILLTFAFVMYIIVKHEVVSPKDIERLLLVYVAGTVTSFLISRAVTTQLIHERTHAFYLNPNSLAVACVLGLHCMIARMLFGRFRSVLVGYAVSGGVSLLLAYVLVITASRTPLVALGVSLLVYVVPLWRSAGRSAGRALALLPMLVAAGLFGASVVMSADQNAAVSRYSMESAQTGSGRFDIWRSAWRVAEDHYFLGVGTAQYRYYHGSYLELLNKLYSPNLSHNSLGTHSDYMTFITNWGLALSLAYLTMLFSLFRRLLRAVRHAELGSFAAPVLLATVSCIVVNQTAHNMMYGPAYFMIMALATGPYLAEASTRQQTMPARSTSASPPLMHART